MLFSALRSSRRSVLALLATAAVLVAAAAYANPLDPGSRGQAQPLAVQSPDRAGSSAGVKQPASGDIRGRSLRFRLAVGRHGDIPQTRRLDAASDRGGRLARLRRRAGSANFVARRPVIAPLPRDSGRGGVHGCGSGELPRHGRKGHGRCGHRCGLSRRRDDSAGPRWSSGADDGGLDLGHLGHRHAGGCWGAAGRYSGERFDHPHPGTTLSANHWGSRCASLAPPRHRCAPGRAGYRSLSPMRLSRQALERLLHG
jgi:hypothetical protein